MVFTDDVAHDARAFLEARAGVEPELAHGEEHAPVHGLEPVAHVGQRAVHDGGKGVSQVALFQRVLQLDGLHGRREENRFVSHGLEVAAAMRRAKMRLREVNRFVDCQAFAIAWLRAAAMVLWAYERSKQSARCSANDG